MEVDCPRCENAGVILVQRQEVYEEKQPDGSTVKKSRTVEVAEKCPVCNGRGKIKSSGSR